MGKGRGKKARQSSSSSRVDRLFIGPHTLERVREFLSWMAAQTDGQVRSWCTKTIYDGVGRQLVMFADRAPAEQQIAQPAFIHTKLVGHLVLAPGKRKKDRKIVVRTFLPPGARQVLAATDSELPRWYLDFQLRRQV